MNNFIFSVRLFGFVRLLALFGLLFALNAYATAPRISASLLGEEKKADIVGYQFSAPDQAGSADDRLIADIVKEAFSAAGKSPIIDILPSKQLAQYALTNNDAGVLIGNPQDLSKQEQDKYRVLVFYFRDVAKKQHPVALIFSKTQGKAWHQAFNAGLQEIIKNGKYIQILEKQRGKGSTPDDYVQRLKQSNPGWK